MSGNYDLVYCDDAEKLRFIGILAYPKTRTKNVLRYAVRGEKIDR